jgi:hypothetical protein
MKAQTGGDEGLRLMAEIDGLNDGNLLEVILEQAGRVTTSEKLRDCWKQ